MSTATPDAVGTAADRSAVTPSAGGLGLALCSAATFATSGTFADSLMHAGWTPAAVVTLRIGLAAVLLTVPGVRSLRGRWSVLRQAWSSVLTFGLISVAGCQLFFFDAVRRLDVGVALLLEYTGILLVVAWLWVRHGQRPRRLTIAGGTAALAGLVLVLNPAAGSVDPVGVLWALLAAVGLAGYFVLSARTDAALPPLTLAWAAMCAAALALALLDVTRVLDFRSSNRDVVLRHHATPWWVPVLGLGLVAAALAYAAGIAAARRLGARLASFVGLTEVLFAVLIAWLVLGQAPDALQLVGGVVVLAGIVLVRADERGRLDRVAQHA